METMSFLSSLFDDKHKVQNAYILLQSSAAQSSLPILRAIINTQQKNDLILVCNLCNPTSLLGSENITSRRIQTFDWTAEVPGYCEQSIDWESRRNVIKSAIEGMPCYILSKFCICWIDDDFGSLTQANNSCLRLHRYTRRRLRIAIKGIQIYCNASLSATRAKWSVLSIFSL